VLPPSPQSKKRKKELKRENKEGNKIKGERKVPEGMT